jgi:hypothetical protein
VATTEATTQPFANTKEVLIYNSSLDSVLYVGWGVLGTLVLTAANSTHVPAGGAITLSIEPEGNRSPAETGGGLAGITLLVACSIDTIEANITYVQTRGINSSGGWRS